jgi:hypothetical protein
MNTTTLKVLAVLAGAFLLSQPAAAQAGFTTLYSFTNGYPTGLTLAKGGLYGGYMGGETGGYGCGKIFFLQAGAGGGAWTETVLYPFADTNDACGPEFGPIIGPYGVLYGITQSGGTKNAGALYELKPPASRGAAWTESILYSFEYTGDKFSAGPFVPGPGGSLYVANDTGVFQLQPPAISGASWAAVLLQSIPSRPTSITPGPDGSLYVTTQLDANGNSGRGSIVQLVPPVSPGGDWTQMVIYTLASQGQGGSPTSLAVASDGTLYGTTFGSGDATGGTAATVFELTPPASSGSDWTYTMLENFGSTHQLAQPLILQGGKLFDAMLGAEGGGGSEDGTVFAMTPPSSGDAWTLNVLYQFAAPPSGLLSIGPQLTDGLGTIYGVTRIYGSALSGTVYRVVP